MSTELPQPPNPPAPAAPPPPHPAEPPPAPLPAVLRRAKVLPRWLDWRVGSVLVLALISIPIWRAVTPHAKAHNTPLFAPVQTVAVARVGREDLYNKVTMYAEFRPYTEVELHAKVSGYLQEINVDIGDKVKAGQLLARLEIPELKSELDRAVAAQKRAEADYKDAHLVYTRLQSVDKTNPNLVAQQELDAAEAKDSIADASRASAKAEVEKYQTLMAYTKIIAPFDGVVTCRYADPGSLIQAGTASDTQARPLVRLSDNYHLRLDFPVSVAYVKDIRLGDTVEVRVDSLGGETFKGIISRYTGKVEETTRTMITEIQVPNPNLELLPGMYATLGLKVQQRPHALALPTEALSTDKKKTVYVVNGEQEIEERPVTTGLETPDHYEVLSGLHEGDLVMIGNRSQVKPGQKVEPKLGPIARQ